MKKIVLFLSILSILFCNKLHSKEIADADIFELYGIAIKNINFSSQISEDSIIKICIDLKAKHQQKSNRDTLFGISEIEINSLCLKGDMGLAINKANLMYEDAKRENNHLGIGLAFQAIGETYLHSNQLKLANENFNEATNYINQNSIPYAQIRLLIQQMYICTELNDMQQLQRNIFRTIEASENIKEELKDDVNFYILCYQTLHAIGCSEAKLAGEYLRKTLDIKFSHNYYDVWKHYINSKYYELIGKYDHSLIYNDSLLQCLEEKNPNAFIKFSIQRAGLYEKDNQPTKSCQIYVEANNMFDSLRKSRYTSQVDSLRVTYWVDQMNIDNAISYNKMLKNISIYGIIILVVMSILISLARKKNKQLKESQRILSEKRYEATDSIQSKSLVISNMSHDLRTPLSAIVSFSSLLANSHESVEKDTKLKQQCTEIINQNSDLLFKRLNDITNISDLKDKNIEFIWDWCDAVALCKNISKTIEKTINPSVIYHFNTGIEQLDIETDQRRLQQVLSNILSNSAKFTSNGYITLQLSLSKENGVDVACFTIEDTGCGIPQEKLASIFQQINNADEIKESEGLGLSICQLIISHIGGRIWLDTSYKHGTKIIFTHPIKTSIKEETKNK